MSEGEAEQQLHMALDAAMSAPVRSLQVGGTEVRAREGCWARVGCRVTIPVQSLLARELGLSRDLGQHAPVQVRA